MADNRDDRLIELAKPCGNVGERRPRLELTSRFDAIQVVLAPQNLRRFVRAGERTGDENVNVRNDLAQPAGGALHLARALGRERTQSVLTAGGGENLAVFGDRVSNDEQFHELALRFLLDEGLDCCRHLERRGIGGVVVHGVDDQHLLIAHDLLC